ncbi:hypothetical protein ACJQWK_09732 [Exserohilum turcicum]|uniref:Uncharacterized protein n=1 Tax=Exserohilum turcicum (strain 28A) TaxID=671987 RepID=R0I5T7_EXST2|nr:uncharacterized protein SETTUDRAFT_24432 [Exserohilum turcica Et28A]EOA80921.1 hypothetical protein SETTUDRAFT_24432 [Exserohilum turcica Et28A]
MQPYEHDKAYFNVDTVTQFCRGVRLEDLNNQSKSKKGTAWLDDRSRPCIPELVPNIQGRRRITSVNHSSNAPARPETTLLQNLNVEIQTREDSTQANPASSSSASLEPRKYAQCLSANELYSHLHEKRFDHANLKDTDRRLIYIADPDPCDILALTATASEHQANALRDVLWQFLDRRTSIKARVEPMGYQVFQLDLHLPYYALRTTPPEKFQRHEKHRTQSDWMDLSPLNDGVADGVKVIHQAQFSLVICGTDNSRWVAYAFEAISFDPDRGDDTVLPEWRSDEISMGELDANNPLHDVREYFLNIFLIRAKHVYEETRELVRFIAASYKRNGQRHAFSLTQGISEFYVGSQRTNAMSVAKLNALYIAN